MKKNEFAPVVLFAFNRPEHTKRTLSALKENDFASDTDLFIYLDGPRSSEDVSSINKVKDIISGIEGFKSVTLRLRNENFGLATNIIAGVTEVLKRNEKVIVMEDDLVTSPNFLKFMNEALQRYRLEKDVWHISGWSYPIKFNIQEDVFLWRTMNCWGWATWSDRWSHFDKQPLSLIERWTKEDVRAFNLEGSCDFWSQVISNYNGKLNTWAIFWYATIFENQGFCVNPVSSHVRNIGHDGSGVNCVETDTYNKALVNLEVSSWPKVVSENKQAVKAIKQFYKGLQPKLHRRFFRKLKKLVIS